MARISRRHEQKEKSVNNPTNYIAGIYSRLSRDKKYVVGRDLSDSINGQIAIVENYIKENPDIVISEIYTDYEFSGTNFDRPAFLRMMKDIKERKINCIIVKDLSRLGREYIEVGKYIETVFPFLGVRFISVNDKFDTAKEMSSGKSLEVTLKNLINDMYAKDLSRKIKTAKQSRMEQGYFVGSVPPYGYKIDKKQEGQKLILDEKSSKVAKEIFDLTISGLTVKEVTLKLNERNYSPPMVYFKTGRLYREQDDTKWTTGSLAKILCNEVYKGDMVQGIKSQYLAEGKKQTSTSKKDQIVILDTHESIIDRETFDELQKERKKRKAKLKMNNKRIDFPVKKEKKHSNLLYCGHCGKEIPQFSYVIKRHGGIEDRYYKFECKKDYANGIEPCRNYIFEDELDEVVLSAINRLITQVQFNREDIEMKNKTYYKTLVQKDEQSLNKLKRKLKYEKAEIQKSYEGFVKGKITKNEFLSIKEECNIREESLNNNIVKLEKIINDIKNKFEIYLKEWDKLIKTKKIDTLTQSTLNAYIDKIILYKERHVKIEFLCKPLCEDNKEVE
ncbi:MAG: recombinase family protein [Peptoniphilaceae bacterium]